MKIYTVGYSRVPNSRNTEIYAHLEEIAKNLIGEHLFYVISIATNNRTPVIFSSALIVKRVWHLGTQEYGAQPKMTLGYGNQPQNTPLSM